MAKLTEEFRKRMDKTESEQKQKHAEVVESARFMFERIYNLLHYISDSLQMTISTEPHESKLYRGLIQC